MRESVSVQFSSSYFAPSIFFLLRKMLHFFTQKSSPVPIFQLNVEIFFRTQSPLGQKTSTRIKSITQPHFVGFNMQFKKFSALLFPKIKYLAYSIIKFYSGFSTTVFWVNFSNSKLAYTKSNLARLSHIGWTKSYASYTV